MQSALVAAFVWQGWVFLGLLVGLPILLAAVLGRKS